MKRVFSIFGVFGVLLLVTCTKNAVVTRTPDAESVTSIRDSNSNIFLQSFSGSFEGMESTKVRIAPETGEQVFEDGDEVLVHVPATSAEGVYLYDGEEQVFKPKDAEQAVAVGSNAAYVYYPAAVFQVEGGRVGFTVPESVTELPGKKTPLAGIIPAGTRAADNPAVTFRNLGSILHFCFDSVREDGETITAVVLSASGTALTGSGEVTWNEEGVPVLAALDGGSVLEATLSEPLHLAAGAKAHAYFFLPPSGECKDLKVSAIYGKKAGNVTYTPSESFVRAEPLALARGKLITVEKTLSGFFGGGDGSAEHPYVIASADDFKAIATLANATSAAGGNGYDAEAGRTFFGSEGVHYQQTADIDFEEEDLTAYMLGGPDVAFSGTYSGRLESVQYVIKNYVLDRIPDGGDADATALFKNVSGASFLNVAIEGARINGGKFSATLVGRATDMTTVSGCSVSNSTISTNAGYGAGGLIGGIYGGTVSDCSVKDLTINNAADGALNRAGGLICYIGGNGDFMHVSGCTVSGNITLGGTGNVSTFGGIVGESRTDLADASLNDCTCTATIGGEKSYQYIGGIVGAIATGTLKVENCTAIGSVSGHSYLGGIAGSMAGGTLSGCTHNGAVVSTSETSSFVGGIVAKITGGTVTDCINDADATFVVPGNYFGGIAATISGGSITATEGQFTENRAKLTTTRSTVGGIAGEVKASISNVRNTAAVTGAYHVGGIGGQVLSGTVTNAHSLADVTGYQNVGGITGTLGPNEDVTAKAKLFNCRVDGANILANSELESRAGGLVGLARLGSWIESCAAFRGTVSGHQDVGGGVAVLEYKLSSTNAKNRMLVSANLVAMDVAAVAPVQSTARIGGFIGYYNCSQDVYVFMYQNGVVGGSVTATECQYVGSFAGYVGCKSNKQRIWDSYSLIEDASFNVTAANENVGGFLGRFTNAALVRNYFSNSINTQAANDNLIQIAAADIRTQTLQGEAKPSVNIDGSAYTTDTWSNPDDVSYPVPTSLVTFGYYK